MGNRSKADAPKRVTGLERLGDPEITSFDQPSNEKGRCKPGAILGNNFHIGDKPGGVEPGHIVVKIDVQFVRELIKKGIIEEGNTKFKMVDDQMMDVKELDEIEEIADIHEREKALIEFLKPKILELHNIKLTEPDEKFRDKVKRLHKLEIFCDRLYKKRLSPAAAANPQLFLIKQDYDERSIAPPMYRLKESKRGKSMSRLGLLVWRRGKEITSSRKKENRNAFGEVFANAVARAFAMPAQNQYVVLGRYGNGDLKVMTESEWNPALESIQGKNAGSKNQAYFVGDNVDGNPRSVINDKFNCPGQNFALMVLQGDDDGIGSMLQNKMRLEKEFFGIDFGHAYRGKNNLLVRNMSIDFTLDDETQKKYKNYSILLDTPPTDKMLGMLYAYKAMSKETKEEVFSPEEIKRIEEVIKEYKEYYKDSYPGFAKKIDQIQPGCVEKLKKEYVEAIHAQISVIQQMAEKKIKEAKAATGKDKQQLTQEAGRLLERAAELQKNIQIIEIKADIHIAHNKELVERFKDRLMLTPQELLLVSNLAKLTSKTRSTDKSGKVELAHLHIEHGKSHLKWNIEHVPGHQLVRLSAKVRPDQGDKIEAVLEDFFKKNNINIEDFTEFNRAGGKIEFDVPANKLEDFMKALDEANIKKFKAEQKPTMKLHTGIARALASVFFSPRKPANDAQFPAERPAPGKKN